MASSQDQMDMISVLSSDNETIRVSRAAAIRSTLLANLLEDTVDDDSPLPLNSATGKTLTKVFEWCEHHKNDPAPTEDNNKVATKEDDPWDRKFMEVDQETLFDLILAANFLDIKPLLDLGCKTVAGMIKGKSPEEIRKTFNIVNDFTPEEEAQIRKENEWAEDR